MASLILFASILTLAFFCNGDLIDDICVRTSNNMISPTSCTEVLRSDPRSRGADLLGLGKIAIKKAKATTKDIVTVARSVLDRNNSGAVRICHELCGRAIDDLNTASKILAGQIDYRTKFNLVDTLSADSTFVGYCEDAFAEDIDGEPPVVKEAIRIAQGLLEVALVIGIML